MINKKQQLKGTFLKLIPSAFLILFLLVLFSCNSTKNIAINEDVVIKRILKENRLNSRKYFVVKDDIIKEDNVYFLRYRTLLRGGIRPHYLDGRFYYYYVSVINNKFYFFDENDENYNIQVLENMKENLTEQQNIDHVNKNYKYYKKGLVLAL
ncbi:hypothetical protein [Flavobacterium beibuense]|uniref:Lipoprotein n=1 Tax=Flavobacterium beibuense TaxID=657326 RepID=A0A444W436_9FLAO|nr:hypothetical protein [Flavobacterium beibuense]RYJ40554.1 hypothetical protein NU09_3384 [Flavobacterium beibuense]